MKLRIHGNSLRLRLSRGESQKLSAGAPLEDAIALRPIPLRYRIDTVTNAEASVSLVRFDGATIRIEISRAVARDWAESSAVGIDQICPETGVRVLIEKDFKCLHGEGDVDQADCFPHPLEQSSSS